MLHIIIYTCVMEVLAQKSKQKYHKSQKQIIARTPDDLPQKRSMNHIKNAKWFTSNIINEISQKLQIKNIKNLKSFCYLKTHKRMIQKKTWHEYSNELKQFLCEVAMSRWATYP